MMKKIIQILLLTITGFNVMAQQSDTIKSVSAEDSLMNALTGSAKPPDDVIATFKSSRLILSQTTETVKKKNFNFLVIHRFGDIGGDNGGAKTFFGLDNSTDIYIGFDYGLSNNLNIGFGRSKYEQMLDLQLKYAALRQTADNRIPVALTLIAKTGFKPYHTDTDVFDNVGNRFSYLGQLIIARKFSRNFSLQLSPGFLRRNLPLNEADESSFFDLGVAGRLKITKRLGIVVDYHHPFSAYRNNNSSPAYHDPLGFGLEIETGGHVFTLNFLNSDAISELNYISNTTSSWGNGQYRFGFTISRMFDFNPKKNHK